MKVLAVLTTIYLILSFISTLYNIGKETGDREYIKNTIKGILEIIGIIVVSNI